MFRVRCVFCFVSGKCVMYVSGVCFVLSLVSRCVMYVWLMF